MSTTSQTPSVTPKSNMSSHPCFTCGLMFAKKTDFDHHESVFHNPADKMVLIVCDQCGKTYFNSTELAEHQMEHDLALLLRALYDQECGIVDAQPQARMQNAAQPQLKRHQMVKPPPPQDDVPAETSIASDQPGETGDANAPASAADLGDHQKPLIEKRLESEPPEPEPMETNTPDATNGQKESESTFPEREPPVVEMRDASFSATSANTEAVSATSGLTPVTPDPPKPPSTPIILSSVCPNCSGSYGKPWLLIEHMIDEHQAQLVRLQRKMTSASGPTLTEEFAEDRCAYCRAIGRDSADNLSHVIRCHRDKLFECPEMGQCDVCFEVLCAVGPVEDATKRKFTIRVKIKRKPK